jgi:hypothetical protein
MDASERARLKELVEKATPGIWDGRAMHDSALMPVAHVKYGTVSVRTGMETARIWDRADCEFIAAFNPETCRALLADLEAAEQARDDAKAALTTAGCLCFWCHKRFEFPRPGTRSEQAAALLHASQCEANPFFKAHASIAAERSRAEAAERERDALREAARWIPVEEKLPELEVRVLCLLADGDVIVSERENLKDCEYENLRPMHGGFDCSNCNGPDSAVTHWQPLPGQTR